VKYASAMDMNALKDLAALSISAGLSTDDENVTLARMIALDAMGFHPLVSLKDLVIHAGALHPSPTLISAHIFRSGRYTCALTNATQHGAQVEFFDGPKNLGCVSYGFEDAQRDGASSLEIYQAHPQELFAARALARGARYHVSHLFSFTVTLPDEAGLIPLYNATSGWSYRQKEAA
jgi:hypothetical protein